MTAVDKVAAFLVDRAARRWPADVAGEMAREWRAELAAMRGESPLRRLRFAVSLAVSPVDFEADPMPRIEAWARSLAGAAGLTLLAGALVNAAHIVQHRAGPIAAAGVWLVAAFLMAGCARRSRVPVVGRTVAIGAALFGFLLAGNRVAVMPFMGWRDILPAVVTWTLATALCAYGMGRIRRRARAALLGVLGGVLAMDLAAITGSLRATTGLGLSPVWAPAWFPLALLPGGTVTFGRPGTQASELLLANASAMVGPMLLCSVFVLTRALGSPVLGSPVLGSPVLGSLVRGSAAPGLPVGESSVRTLSLFGVRFDSRTVWGVGAAMAALAAGDFFRRMPPGSFEGTWRRLLDNSAVFGFGFLADTGGRVVTALVAGLVATHLGVRRRTIAG